MIEISEALGWADGAEQMPDRPGCFAGAGCGLRISPMQKAIGGSVLSCTRGPGAWEGAIHRSASRFIPFFQPLGHKWVAIERYQRLSMWESALTFHG